MKERNIQFNNKVMVFSEKGKAAASGTSLKEDTAKTTTATTMLGTAEAFDLASSLKSDDQKQQQASQSKAKIDS